VFLTFQSCAVSLSSVPPAAPPNAAQYVPPPLSVRMIRSCTRKRIASAPGLPPRLREHAFREVDGGDGGAPRREPERVPGRAAAQVERGAAADVVERAAHHRLLERDQRVPVVIVDGGPAIVSGADLGHLTPQA